MTAGDPCPDLKHHSISKDCLGPGVVGRPHRFSLEEKFRGDLIGGTLDQRQGPRYGQMVEIHYTGHPDWLCAIGAADFERLDDWARASMPITGGSDRTGQLARE
jgi:hypothetical protein